MTRLLAPLFLILSLGACTQAPAPTVERSPSAQARAAGPGEYMVKPGDTLYRIAKENGLDHVELAAQNNIDNPAALRVGQILRLRPANAASTSAAAPVATPIGVATGVEARSLDGKPAAPAAVAGGSLREPRGGKEAYSDEAYARLNNQAPAAATQSAPTPAPATSEAPAAAAATAGPAEVEGVVWAWPTKATIKAAYNGSSNKGIDFAGKQGDPVLAAGEGRVLYVGDALAGYGKLVIVKHSTDHLSVYAHNSKILVKEGQPVKLGQKIAEMGNSGTDSVKLHFEIRKQGKPVDPTPFLPKR